eukprot:6490246-Amphidinium_carterae.5
MEAAAIKPREAAAKYNETSVQDRQYKIKIMQDHASNEKSLTYQVLHQVLNPSTTPEAIGGVSKH